MVFESAIFLRHMLQKNCNVNHEFMAHAEDYGLVPYRPIILQYYEIPEYYSFLKTAVYGTLTEVTLQIRAYPLLQPNIW